MWILDFTKEIIEPRMSFVTKYATDATRHGVYEEPLIFQLVKF
jgi:hypothetical protein